MTRLVVAGSREVESYTYVADQIEQWIKTNGTPSLFLLGGARGVDKLAEKWAKNNSMPYYLYIPNWDVYGRSAGPRRNIQMASNADALLAIWNGVSLGTKHMISIAKAKKLQTTVVMWKENEG